MSSKDKNLSEVPSISLNKPESIKVGVAVALWNEEITSSLWEGCKDYLLKQGLLEKNIIKVEVPGTFELPMACKMLIQSNNLQGTVAIGCVIKGETSHNEYINNAVANGLVQLSLLSSTPCIFGVLTPNSMEQALERAGGSYGNKGVEAGSTLLQMISLDQSLQSSHHSIGF